MVVHRRTVEVAMSDAAFSAWANAVSEAIANGDCSVEDGDWVWPPPEPWLSTIAPELEFSFAVHSDCSRKNIKQLQLEQCH